MKSVRIAFALILLFGFGSALIAAEKAPGKTAPKEMTVTGQHRGYTNDELFVRPDGSEKEMTFIVRIPGDTDAKWHDAFQVSSHITVTYHNEKGQKHPIATDIKAAVEK